MAPILAKVTEPRTGRSHFMRRIERRVLDYAAQQQIFAPNEGVIVAVSGGPDSTALLLIMHQLAERIGIRLSVAHFDHRLRGHQEAAADVAYVSALASQMNLPFRRGGGDVRARAVRRGESLEDASRRARYAFFKRCAKSDGATVVLTGHTLDDQAETVLLHIVRGSGLDGLAGIRPRASWPFGAGPDVARPLLSLSRTDTEKYCSQRRLSPRYDGTNQLLNASRNRVRLRVLPELQAINPRVANALARLADSASEDAAYLAAVSHDAYRTIAQAGSDSVAIPKKDLADLPPPIAVRVILRAIERASGTRADIEAVHLEEVLGLAARPPARVSFPNGVTVESDSASIHFHKGTPASVSITESCLMSPGETQVGTWIFEIAAGDPRDPTPRGPFVATLDARAVQGAIRVRSRQAGDFLRPRGVGGRKKLQDILVDAKVPSRQRDSVPILFDDAGILWVVGHCLDERAALASDTQSALRITARPVIVTSRRK
jgi:tRNA(Ile)-lysidine synthase